MLLKLKQLTISDSKIANFTNLLSGISALSMLRYKNFSSNNYYNFCHYRWGYRSLEIVLSNVTQLENIRAGVETEEPVPEYFLRHYTYYPSGTAESILWDGFKK